MKQVYLAITLLSPPLFASTTYSTKEGTTFDCISKENMAVKMGYFYEGTSTVRVKLANLI